MERVTQHIYHEIILFFCSFKTKKIKLFVATREYAYCVDNIFNKKMNTKEKKMCDWVIRLTLNVCRNSDFSLPLRASFLSFPYSDWICRCRWFGGDVWHNIHRIPLHSRTINAHTTLVTLSRLPEFSIFRGCCCCCCGCFVSVIFWNGFNFLFFLVTTRNSLSHLSVQSRIVQLSKIERSHFMLCVCGWMSEWVSNMWLCDCVCVLKESTPNQKKRSFF